MGFGAASHCTTAPPQYGTSCMTMHSTALVGACSVDSQINVSMGMDSSLRSVRL